MLKTALLIFGGFCFVGLIYIYYRTISYYYDWDKRKLAEKKREEEQGKK